MTTASKFILEKKYFQQHKVRKNLHPSAVSQIEPPIHSNYDNNNLILVKYYTTQGKVISESGTHMKVCLERVGVSVINLVITMGDDVDDIGDDTINYTYYVVAGVIAIPKLTEELF